METILLNLPKIYSVMTGISITLGIFVLFSYFNLLRFVKINIAHKFRMRSCDNWLISFVILSTLFWGGCLFTNWISSVMEMMTVAQAWHIVILVLLKEQILNSLNNAKQIVKKRLEETPPNESKLPAGYTNISYFQKKNN